jgi:hypothetical protein
MKNYEKLTIPKDSAWDRSTIWKRLHWRIRNFLIGCKNIIKWTPTLFKDRDWDQYHIYTILQKKIEFQRKEIVYANRSTRVWQDNRDMTIILNLLEKVKDGYYESENTDYYEMKVETIPVDGTSLKQMKFEVLSERYDEYLNKYKSSVRKVLKEEGEIDKETLCMLVATYNQEKARKLLFNMLNEKIEGWWD